MTGFQKACIGIVALGVALAQIDQPFPQLSYLQHGPVVLLLLASPWLLRRWPPSNASCLCITLFLMLHTLGGRYIYSFVPYDDWARALTGASLGERFGWSRNHYDRLVHFAFGLLSVLPVAEFQQRNRAASRGASLRYALIWVLGISCLYEIFEWLLTIMAAGDMADNYNGQQGDLWDPQKDMALAGLGAVLAASWQRLSKRT
jgi:putative membrane protein